MPSPRPPSRRLRRVAAATAGLLAIGVGAGACFRATVRASGPPPMEHPAYGVWECPERLSIRPFRDDGRFGDDWSATAGRLAFNRQAPDGHQALYVSLPDGGEERALTFHNPVVPAGHACSPVWSPDGGWLFFSSEKAHHPGSSLPAFCGFGAYSDVWAMSADGTRAFPLTDVPNDSDHGAMIPRLSRDGRKLLWTERTGGPNVFVPERAFGSWVLAVAEIDYADSGVSLSHVEKLSLGDEGFYEGADFTPDGAGVLYTSSSATHNAWSSQIFVVDLSTRDVHQLTHADYNEHPRYTPDGRRILWMSSTGAKLKGTDWWVMDPDGGGKRRLTFFEDPEDPQSSGSAVYPGTQAWDPEGKWFIGDIETSLVRQTYTTVVVSCAAAPDAGP